MIPRSRFAAATLAASLLGAPTGCLDFTPITVVHRDGGGLDDATADGQSAASVACFACADRMEDAGGCASELAQCDALAACQATTQCVLASCFEPGVNIEQCLVGCETSAGITSVMGPAKVAFASFLQCMSTRCQAACLR